MSGNEKCGCNGRGPGGSRYSLSFFSRRNEEMGQKGERQSPAELKVGGSGGRSPFLGDELRAHEGGTL